MEKRQNMKMNIAGLPIGVSSGPRSTSSRPCKRCGGELIWFGGVLFFSSNAGYIRKFYFESEING